MLPRVAVSTAKARKRAEESASIAFKEASWQNDSPLHEHFIPPYDSAKDPNCRVALHSRAMETRPSTSDFSRSGGSRPAPRRSDDGFDESAFAAVAAAFDFEHHAGTDSRAEMAVLKAVVQREALLSKLEVLAERLIRAAHRSWALHEPAAALDVDARTEAVETMVSLRQAAVSVCDAVRRWREASDPVSPGTAPPAFLWHGRNYLLKMSRSDMDFVASIEPLAQALGVDAAKMKRNPLMLPRTLDDALRDARAGLSVDVDDDDDGAQMRISRAETLLLDEERFSLDRERERLTSPEPRTRDLFGTGRIRVQEPQGDLRARAAIASSNRLSASWAGGSLSQRFGALPQDPPAPASLEAAADAGWGPRKHELVTWFDDAQQQLRDLKSRASASSAWGEPQRSSTPKSTRATSRQSKLRPIKSTPQLSRSMPRARAASPATDDYAGPMSRTLNSSMVRTLGSSASTPALHRRVRPPKQSPEPAWHALTAETGGGDDIVFFDNEQQVVGPEMVRLDAAPPDAATRRRQRSAAAAYADAAVASAKRAAAAVTPAGLVLLALSKPVSDELAMLCASTLTLVHGAGAEARDARVPPDVRWAAFVQRVAGNGTALAEQIAQVAPGAVLSFKRRALQRFFGAATSNWADSDGKVLRAAKLLEAWIRATLAAADACAFAADGDDVNAEAAAAAAAKAVFKLKKRRPQSARSEAAEVRRPSSKSASTDVDLRPSPKSASGDVARRPPPKSTETDGRSVPKSAAVRPKSPAGPRKKSGGDEVLCTLLRTDLGPVPGAKAQAGDGKTPWLVTVLRRKTGFDVKAYHPATSTEAVMHITDAEAAAAMGAHEDARAWAAATLPRLIEVFSRKGSPLPRLRIAKATALQDVAAKDVATDGAAAAAGKKVPAATKAEKSVPKLEKSVREKEGASSKDERLRDRERLESVILALEDDSGRFDELAWCLPDDLASYLDSDDYAMECQVGFDRFDSDSNGVLTTTELVPLVAQLAASKVESVSSKHCSAVVQKFDRDGSGVIDRGDFVGLCKYTVAVLHLRASQAKNIQDSLRDLRAVSGDVETFLKANRDVEEAVVGPAFVEEAFKRMQLLDKDGDCSLSAGELPPLIAELLDVPPATVTPAQCRELLGIFAGGEAKDSISAADFADFVKVAVIVQHLRAQQQRLSWDDSENDGSADTENDDAAQNGDDGVMAVILAKLERGRNDIAELASQLPPEIEEYLLSESFTSSALQDYDSLDVDGSRTLTADELIPVVASLAAGRHVKITDDESAALMAYMDREGHGSVSRDDFVAFAQFVVVLSWAEHQRAAGEHQRAAENEGAPEGGASDVDAAETDQFITFIDDRGALDGREEDVLRVLAMLPDDLHAYLRSKAFDADCVAKYSALDVDGDGRLTPDKLAPLVIQMAEASGTALAPAIASLNEITALARHRGSNGADDAPGSVGGLDGGAKGFLDSSDFVSLCRLGLAGSYLKASETRRIADVLDVLKHGFRNGDVEDVLALLPQTTANVLCSAQFIDSTLKRYSELDVDKSGTLTIDEMWPVVCQVAGLTDRISVTQFHCGELTKLVDANGNGTVDREEFVRFTQIMCSLRYLSERAAPRRTPFLQRERERVDSVLADVAAGNVDPLMLLRELSFDVVAWLTSDEFAEECELRFMDHDPDGSGTLSPDEVAPVVSALAGIRGSVAVTPRRCAVLAKLFSQGGAVHVDEFLLLCQFIFSTAEAHDADLRRIDVLLASLAQGRHAMKDLEDVLPDDLDKALRSINFEKACLVRFDSLDAKSGLTLDELRPLVVDLARSSLGAFTVTPDQYMQFSKMFKSDRNGFVDRREFVHFAQFVIIFEYVAEIQAQLEDRKDDAPSRRLETRLQVAAQANASLEKRLASKTDGQASVDDLLVMLQAGRIGFAETLQLVPGKYREFVDSSDFARSKLAEYDALDSAGDGALPLSSLWPAVVETAAYWEALGDGLLTEAQCGRFFQMWDQDQRGTVDRSDFVELAQYVLVAELLERTQKESMSVPSTPEVSKECATIGEALEALEQSRDVSNALAFLPAGLREALLSEAFDMDCQAEFADALDGKMSTIESGLLKFEVLMPLIVRINGSLHQAVSGDHCLGLLKMFDGDSDGKLNSHEFHAATRYVAVHAHMTHQRNAARRAKKPKRRVHFGANTYAEAPPRERKSQDDDPQTAAPLQSLAPLIRVPAEVA
ncbi:hypothetical protein M885DRAFT_576200 [Pelagophyceae sp. CCMP2097]|nr:hypothetical protein M885DRAFT_576200 [Pelagophyceae sp. CCMP2097]